MPELTHLNAAGHAHMVEVGDKAITSRMAIAEGAITLSTVAFQALLQGNVPKGDVLAVARLAGITAAKRTSDLVPLCHPIPLTGVAVQVTPQPPNTVRVQATVRCEWRTGVEMEALTAVSAALLTVYDMVKAIDKGPEIHGIHLLEKRGGRSGTYLRKSPDPGTGQ
jgi:cyclic pyranopterin phosphate synthase